MSCRIACRCIVRPSHKGPLSPRGALRSVSRIASIKGNQRPDYPYERPFFFNQSISTGKNFFRFEVSIVLRGSSKSEAALEARIV